MDKTMMVLISVVSSVAAWGITQLISSHIEQKKQKQSRAGVRLTTWDSLPPYARRNKILAGGAA